MFVDRSVPRISRTGSASAFVGEMKERLTKLIQAAVDAGHLPQGTNPHAVFRILSAAVVGAAVLQLCNRLAPGEDADALARDTLEAALTGLRTGFPHQLPVRGMRRFSPLVVRYSSCPVIRCFPQPPSPGAGVSDNRLLVGNAAAAAAGRRRGRPLRDDGRRREPAARAASARDRIAPRRRTGRSQRRARRPHDGDAGRARNARRRRRAAGAHLRLRDVGAAAGGRSQRRTNRGAARVWRPAQTFDPEARAGSDERAGLARLAEAEFGRIQSLLDQKVVSQSEFDQRRTQVEAARQQYKVALNVAEQSYRSLQAARARVALANKSVADTAVRAPFAGLVAERAVSVGDYVTKGARVATVVSIDPLRVELTVPEQAIAQIKVGQPVRLTVDAYPGEEFTATVRFVSPSVRVDQRALTVEAVAPNKDGRLKPGLFATALIQQGAPAPALTVPETAVETCRGTSRVYVVKDGKAEERIVTLGEKVSGRIEITTGLTKGESVVAEPRGRITDGMPVRNK